MTQCPTIPVRIAAGVLLLVGIVTAVLATSRSTVREPELNGVPLSHFLDRQTYGELRTERDARESIRDFGTNAVPYLIAILDAREARLRIALREWLPGVSLVQNHLPPLFVRQRQAALACAELGPLATPASAALTRLVEDPLLCRYALGALAMIGPQNFTVLTNALVSTNRDARAEAAGVLRYMTPRHAPVEVLLGALDDADPEVRSNAAGSLAFLKCQLERVVPALLTRLGDSNAIVRVNVAQSLGWLQREAVPALPALVKLREETSDPADEVKIAEAIRLIEAAPIETGGLR
jgi:hypothetical protein